MSWLRWLLMLVLRCLHKEESLSLNNSGEKGWLTYIIRMGGHSLLSHLRWGMTLLRAHLIQHLHLLHPEQHLHLGVLGTSLLQLLKLDELLHDLGVHLLRLHHLLALLHLQLHSHLHLRGHRLLHHWVLGWQAHYCLLRHHQAHRHRLSGEDRVTHYLLVVVGDVLLNHGE